MKRSVLLFFFSIVLFTSANSQWYKWKYGADSLDLLSRSQLEESLKKETFQKTKNIYGLTFGSVALIAGIIMINGPGSNPDVGKAIGIGILGATFIACGIVILPIEIISILIHSGRIMQIKEELNMPEVQLGILNCPTTYLSRVINNHPVTGVTVTFSF